MSLLFGYINITHTNARARYGYEVPGMIFIACMPVYLQLTKRAHLQSTPLEQLYTWPNDAATIGTGTPVVE